MSFDKLPENCLWKIFDNFDELEELIQLSKVCSKWYNLISIRFSKVKYLLHSDVVHFDYSKIWIEKELTFKYNLRKLLPNLRILNVSCGVPYTSMNFNVSPPEVRDHFKFPPEYFQDVVNNNPKIKGVLGIRAGLNLDLENIEMVEMDYMLDCKRIFRPDQLRQIRFKRDFFFESLPKYIEYFPNLKRLNITFNGEKVLYAGPNLCNLKVLEFASDRWNLSVYGFYLMNFCPSLESAFMSCSDGLYSISPSEQNVNRYTDISLKNYNLRDLVLKKHYVGSEFLTNYITWPFLRRLLSKYPNIQNLAIRGGDTIEDNLVEELVKLLPMVKLLDFRRSKGVTSKSADFLSKFCLESNRSIKIYYDCEEEPTDWPKLSTSGDSIVYGFDFMKHCFYKSFHSLPCLIDE